MTMLKRPTCDYCQKPESGFCVLGGLFACAECLLAFDKAQKQNTQQIVMEQINRIKNGN